jgi:hypothetical protein
MTDRIPLDDMTSDQLDQLYDERDRAQAEAARWGAAESADVAAGSYAGRVEELQATIERIRTCARDALTAGDTSPGAEIGRFLLHLLDEQDQPVPCPACQRADQAGLAPDEQHDDCAGAQPLGGVLPSGMGATADRPPALRGPNWKARP